MAETKEFLYRLSPIRVEMLTEGPTREEISILTHHGTYLADLTEQGTVHLAGRTQNEDANAFGIVIFDAPNEDAARKIMEDDPAVRGGIMEAELFPFKTAFWTSPRKS